MRSMARAALAVLLLSAAPARADDLGVQNPYAISTMPGAPTGSAYMLIRNQGDRDDRLVGASSPVAGRVELHTSTEENGILRMGPVESGLPVPAGGELDLSRGGPHLMFLGITDGFEDGDVIEVTLTFEQAGDMTVQVPVDLDRLTGDSGHYHAQGHDAGHAHEPSSDAGAPQDPHGHHMDGTGG